MSKMKKSHKRMVKRMLAMMKTNDDYSNLDEIRIMNDGGGTGTWHVAIKRHEKPWVAANFAFHSIFAEPEDAPTDDYYDEG